MKNTLFKKGLVLGIIILFICIGFKPALSNKVTKPQTSVDKELKSDEEIEKKPTPISWCILLIKTGWIPFSSNPLKLPNCPISIENLETGVIKYKKTNLFGFKIFYVQRNQRFLCKSYDIELLNDERIIETSDFFNKCTLMLRM